MTADQWNGLTEKEQCDLVRFWLYFGVSSDMIDLLPVDTKAEGVIPFVSREAY